jgi:hypothetical protein
MIISVSRRTDIPAIYKDWFYNRIKEGFVLARNPMNFNQARRISLAPEDVDGIVFWTKNPLPMLGRLDELKDFAYYFQFTVTPYAEDIEPALPPKRDIISAFKRLSELIGPDRVIWRYDPILLNPRYDMDYHIGAFGEMANELRGYTRKVTISFIDTDYRGVKSNMKELALSDFPYQDKVSLASSLAAAARSFGLTVNTCAEEIELGGFGIERASCIDASLFEKLLNRKLSIKKDKNQRKECGCSASVDIGMYNTCLNGCRYCYANYNKSAVSGNRARHDPDSPAMVTI